MSLQLLEDAQLQLDELEATYFQMVKGKFHVKSVCVTDLTNGPLNTSIKKLDIVLSDPSGQRTFETTLLHCSRQRRASIGTDNSLCSAFELIYSAASGISLSGDRNTS